MAEVVNTPEQTAVSKAPKISVDEIKPFHPDPVVVSPVKAGAVDEAVKALREDIGRPIYLDMQVSGNDSHSVDEVSSIHILTCHSLL